MSETTKPSITINEIDELFKLLLQNGNWDVRCEASPRYWAELVRLAKVGWNAESINPKPKGQV